MTPPTTIAVVSVGLTFELVFAVGAPGVLVCGSCTVVLVPVGVELAVGDGLLCMYINTPPSNSNTSTAPPTMTPVFWFIKNTYVYKCLRLGNGAVSMLNP